jgi:hypothetical protein
VLGGFFIGPAHDWDEICWEPKRISLTDITSAGVVSNGDQLLQINRQVAEGMLRVAQQERLLAELERGAHPARDARAVLAAFKQTLQQMIDRRKEILLSHAKPREPDAHA